MADGTPWFIYMTNLDEGRGFTANNRDMVQELCRTGSLRSEPCAAAFEAVDRQQFWASDTGHLAYADVPLRNGVMHLSAPHIYAKSLECLMPLRRGMSFLNVGSGTGYFNSLVSELIGEEATNHGVDIHPEAIAHANACCGRLGKGSIAFTLGNVYHLNVRETSRYDRIYVGACAGPRSKYLFELLEVGGVLVGPFQAGSSQQLRRVTRRTETHFDAEVLGSVQFSHLVEPPPPRPPPPRPPPPCSATPPLSPLERESGGGGGPGAASAGVPAACLGGAGVASSGTVPGAGLPGVQFTFALKEKAWTPTRNWLYPEPFRQVVAAQLLGRPCDAGLPCIPTEIWAKHILPCCSRHWFQPASSLDGRATTPAAAARSGGCAEDDDSFDSDGGSTRAQTPQMTFANAPIEPPTPPHWEPALVEVFAGGQWHYIGTAGDPDNPPQSELELPAHPLRPSWGRAERRWLYAHGMRPLPWQLSAPSASASDSEEDEGGDGDAADEGRSDAAAAELERGEPEGELEGGGSGPDEEAA